MYHRPHFLEELHAIREEMSRECDYDMDLFAEKVRDKGFKAPGTRKRTTDKKKIASTKKSPGE
jgi:DNA-binding ferritin-like protein